MYVVLFVYFFMLWVLQFLCLTVLWIVLLYTCCTVYSDIFCTKRRHTTGVLISP